MNDSLAVKMGKLTSGELSFFNLLSTRIEKDMVICDIGGGIGSFSEKCLSTFGANIKQVLIFEPCPNNFAKIKTHPLLNKINKGIYYGKTSSLLIHTGDKNKFGKMLKVLSDEHVREFRGNLTDWGNRLIELDELENYVSKDQNLWLAKIDVERSEYNIIENSTILKEFKFLIVEWHGKSHNQAHKFIKTHLPDYKIILSDSPDNHTLLEKNGKPSN